MKAESLFGLFLSTALFEKKIQFVEVEIMMRSDHSVYTIVRLSRHGQFFPTTVRSLDSDIVMPTVSPDGVTTEVTYGIEVTEKISLNQEIRPCQQGWDKYVPVVECFQHYIERNLGCGVPWTKGTSMFHHEPCQGKEKLERLKELIQVRNQ